MAFMQVSNIHYDFKSRLYQSFEHQLNETDGKTCEVKHDSCFSFEIPASVSNSSNLISENVVHKIASIQLPKSF